MFTCGGTMETLAILVLAPSLPLAEAEAGSDSR